ncbi:galactan 5-O-arabinofuranosyltransferase [Mycolicibacterium fortuitum]|uniref:Galactan 5-O-arabinofuranosyltransferase n=3 Tax=Mycolicibacterium fortuitum TaxID=1766 RepID=A0A378UY33_MYCFO|nr:galactan 5-O-arabinofuranosyltransferase [Mycolicibacterium fortuitum]AIY49873.2 Arabinofuranosyltransferase AftA [Mycobacterium sp. VKM Ac-1817D]CRL80906.1 membrane protein [Mycolicibacter nonchromogenicus]EJZ10023.1 arabinofuranosyl transferase A [Mycolicibacterium fortuitum subsp. fortuitum DSM 46621 = ATCC 6841 = JCM 6387]MCA4726476.1 galactan 5-O-arabinofuranosyltransferase [Mycolicibacterium fortuitum]MDG5771365.1 galactan 5-O-arabinofuranosyltransferase [Mycolicibacterium fortuitum]
MPAGLAGPARVAGHMVIALMIASAVAGVSIAAIAQVQWPAYNTSNQLHALTTVGQVGALAGIFAAGLIWRRGRRTLARLAALIFLSAFAVVTLAMPLGATKLYLFGVSVDQQFRTEYLTRLADAPGLHDMTYFGLPPYYPAGWFWMGGRIAAGTDTPAWEMFKPWSIVSITIAVALAFVLWAAMIRFESALIVTTAGTAAMLAYASTEPYAAIITVLLPPVFVLAWSGLRGQTRPGEPGIEHSGGWAAIIGVGIFLGFAALFYTLLLAYCAFTLAIMGLVLAIARRSFEPLLRGIVIAAIAGAIALLTWGPYLLAALRGQPAEKGTAQHYLPDAGAQLTFPMLSFTLLGALCMLGTLWLVVRARTSTRAGALAVAVLAVYAWSLLSMLTTLAGTTLLSFRLQPTLTVLLTTAGAFGFIEATQAVARRYQPDTARRVTAAAAAVGAIGAVTFSQDIPDVLRPDINVAYSDTDGTGQRADRRPPGAERYYREIDAKIAEVTGVPRNQTVVLTADYSFLSFYPYYGFQGLTSHYANPLAEFDKRAKAIEGWATLAKADDFVKALDELPWKAPTVFLMRHGANDTYTLRLASDVYPNQPNVRRYHVALDAALFKDPRFEVTDIGPFVLAIRKPTSDGH